MSNSSQLTSEKEFTTKTLEAAIRVGSSAFDLVFQNRTALYRSNNMGNHYRGRDISSL